MNGALVYYYLTYRDIIVGRTGITVSISAPNRKLCDEMAARLSDETGAGWCEAYDPCIDNVDYHLPWGYNLAAHRLKGIRQP